MENLKEIRIERKLTQKEAAEAVNVSLRSYKTYENDEKKIGTIKYNYIIETLKKKKPIDEEHGIISIEDIKEKCGKVLEKYDITYCYLFGSYAKGKAGPASDVNLLVSGDIKGLRFYGMVEEIRNILYKRVDILDIKQLEHNFELTQEILRDGIKIYG